MIAEMHFSKLKIDWQCNANTLQAILEVIPNSFFFQNDALLEVTLGIQVQNFKIDLKHLWHSAIRVCIKIG